MNPVWHFLNGVPNITLAAIATNLAGDGSVTAPSYGFASQPNTGWYHTGTGASSLMRLSVNGTNTLQLDSAAGLYLPVDTAGISIGVTSPVVLSRGAANRLDLASGDSLLVISGDVSCYGGIVGGGAFNIGGLAGSATSARRIIKKVTAMGDGAAVDVITVTVPNSNQSAGIKVSLLSSNGSTDAFESSRVAEGFVVLARTSGVATVAAVAALDLAQIATVGGGATHTLAYGVSAISGLASATQTFTITVTVNDSGNVGSNQVVCVAEVINSEASGVTIA